MANNIPSIICHMKAASMMQVALMERRCTLMLKAWRKETHMPNEQNMINKVTALDGSYITVHYERCVLVRNCNADCLRCAGVCTSGCISYDGNELTIDASKCIGCGTCATVCPTCCLEAHHPNDAELEQHCLEVAEQHDGDVCIACGTYLDMHGLGDGGSAAARVECLGRVEESLLVGLAASGHGVTLVHGPCETCLHNSGRRMLDEVLDTRNKLLDAWGAQVPCALAQELPWPAAAAQKEATSYATEPNTAVNTQPKGEASFLKVMEDGTLPHFVPDRRERLLDSLASLGEPDDQVLATRLWGHVVIDMDKCHSCRMCSVFCPTGALSRFDEEDGTFGVEHYAGDCIKCRLCEGICMGGAITVTDEVKATDMLDGLTDRYEMKPLEVERSGPHTIVNMARTFTGGTQVYER